MNDNHNENTDLHEGTSPHEELCSYILDELDEQAAARVEAALEASADLRAERTRIAATIDLVRANCGGGESLSPEILSALQSAAHAIPKIAPRRLLTPMRVAAAVVIIAAGVFSGRALFDQPRGDAASERIANARGSLHDASTQLANLPYLKGFNNAVSEESQIQGTAAPSTEPAGVSVIDLNGLGQGSGDMNSTPSPVARHDNSGEAPTQRPHPNPPRLEYSPPNPSKQVFNGGTVTFGGVVKPQTGGNQRSMPSVGATDRDGEAAGRPQVWNTAVGLGGGAGATPPAKQPVGDNSSRGEPPILSAGARSQPSAGAFFADGGDADIRARTESFYGFLFGESRGFGRPDAGIASRTSTAGRWIDDTTRTPEQTAALINAGVDHILKRCRRHPNERPAAMFFRFWGDNAFELAQLDNKSTFGLDVDTASYALARRYLAENRMPEKAQIRTEEFVNYFKPDLAAPTEGTFLIRTDLAPSRYGAAQGQKGQQWMMRVVVRGRAVARGERTPLALTFVVDVSGSMKENNRLELVKHSLRLLCSQLGEGDSLAIVAFSNEARMVLPMTPVADRGIIEAAIYGLQPGGGTNAEAGLRLGYEASSAALGSEATSRVVLLSDGVANVGQTDQDRINADVKRQRDKGIYLNTIGVGMGNHSDHFLEQLANKGDGLCNYIDTAVEAHRALVENFTGAFEPIARDVKLQVEFDASQVYRYRLLGYENRAIADADFRNDAVDAGEIGAGHQVVALYEIELTNAAPTKPLAEVHLRWKAPTGAGRDPLEDSATELAHVVDFAKSTTWEAASNGYKCSTLVAQFAEILRRSVHARDDSLDQLIGDASALAAAMEDPDFVEFVAMLRKSRALILSSLPEYGDLARCVDSIRRNRILRAQHDDLRRGHGHKVVAELEKQNKQLEARIRELIRGELAREDR